MAYQTINDVPEKEVQNELVFVKGNQVVTDSLMIAEVFEKEHKNVMRDIRTQIEYAGEGFSLHNFVETPYKDSMNRDKLKFELTEEAFALVVMSYNTKEAVQTKIKFIQEFKRMKEHIQKQQTPMTTIEMIAGIAQHAVEMEHRQRALERKLSIAENKLESIKEVVAINSIDWRNGTNSILKKIATKLGGFEMYRKIRSESYELLNRRAKADLERRLVNMKRKMAEDGYSLSKRNKVCYLDVIAQDQRLIEIYVAVVKEMAIKYGIDVPKTA